MFSCPVCHRPGDGEFADCPTCHVPMVAAAPQHQFAVPGAPSGVGQPQPRGPYSSDDASPYPAAPPTGPPGPTGAAGPPLGFVPMQFGAPPPPVPGPGAPTAPPGPAWDRAGATRGVSTDQATSPVVVITAIVIGVLLVAAVGWFTLTGDDSTPAAGSNGPATTLTPAVIPDQPVAGQTKPLADGWVTYRSVDGAWLFDTPVVPSAPSPLPSNPTIQIAYGLTDTGRIGFGWSSGQLPEGTDEGAVLVEIMKGIAVSRGAHGIEPTVLPAPTGPVVTAKLQLSSGSALFVLRSIDRHPVIAMVVSDLTDPDAAIATRMLDSFRPAA